MLYQKNVLPELPEELFLNPTAEYRGTPFWSWNCRVTEELISHQTEVFQKMGFGGAHLHARTGLDIEYMSEEFLELVKYAASQAKERNMLCWLYDEDRFPSGAAGGIVTGNWHYRSRYLLLTRERKENMSGSREEFYQDVANGKKPAGYYVTAYRVKTNNGYLHKYFQVEGEQPLYNSQAQIEEEGELWYAYMELMPESPWYNNNTYVDAMNREAIERFIEVTHERYYKALGDEFGKTIPAIFTDEPQVRGSMALADGEAGADVTLSFTDDFRETFMECYGTDILKVLPELMWESEDGKASVHRYRYHEHLTERFVSAFSDTIARWCEEHGIALTGHYMSEPTLYSQTLRLGEAMRCYRRQQLPGVDILCGDPEYSTIKQASSVAHQYGREGVLSELYGVTHWDFDFKGHKLQGDWQAALGVTVRVHHLAFMSMEGESKRDWPASINYQSPWWGKYEYIENYFSRLNTALTRGRADVRIAVVHPIESYWISYGPVGQTGDERAQMDENFRNVIEWLLFGLLDFDFVSESLLPELCDGEKPCESTEDKALWQVGRMAYSAVVVPGLKTIRSTTLALLEKLAEAGGKVIFMGRIPHLVDGERSDRAVKLAEKCMRIPYQQYELLEALKEERTLSICHEDGRRSDNLFYQMREDGDCKWLFVCHVNRKRNQNDRPEKLRVDIKGSYELSAYDALTGEIRPVEGEYRNGWTRVGLELYGEDSFLWKLIPAKVCECAAEGAEPETTQFKVPTGSIKTFYGLVAGIATGQSKAPAVADVIYRPQGYRLEEPNVLLLDQASWKLDDGPWNPPCEILRLDNEIRALLRYPMRRSAYAQPWAVKDAPENNVVTLVYEILSEVATGELLLAMERPEKVKFFLNQVPCDNSEQGWYVDSFIRTIKLPGLQKGKNELRLEISYGQKTNLENMFLLGDFGVEVRGTEAVVTEPAGELLFGDVTRQRLPFYGGNIIYSMEFALEKEQEISIRVPHFSAPVIGVSIDGEEKGLIAFAPHVLSVGRLSAGTHRLELCLYGNRFNSFGTLHNCNDEYKWYGPDSYRTRGSEWSENWCLRPFGIMSRVEIIQD